MILSKTRIFKVFLSALRGSGYEEESAQRLIYAVFAGKSKFPAKIKFILWNKYKIDLAFLKNRESLEELRERLENEED